MTDASHDTAADAGSLTTKAVLGLDDPNGARWAYFRGLQYSRLRDTLSFRIGTQILAAALIIAVLFAHTPLWIIGSWIVAGALAVLGISKLDKSLSDTNRRKISRKEVHAHCRMMVVLAVIWSLPLYWSAISGDTLSLAYCTGIVATALAASAMIAAVPLAVVLFTTVFSGLAVGAFLLGGLPLGAVILSGYAFAICAGTIATGRLYLSSSLARTAVLEKSETVSLLLREYEEHKADWLWQIDINRRIRQVSPRFAFALGRNPEEVEGNSFFELIAGDAWSNGAFPPSLHDLAERLKRRESFSNLLVRVTLDGQKRWWELSGTPMLDDRGRYVGFRGVGSDVTEQRESSEKIAYLARYDTLTGLPNRLMLNEALGDAMRYAKQWRTRCAFMMIDLDRFKAVNDSLGHLVGDQMLAKVAKRLEDLMGENELCGRLGGDEFAIVIRDASDAERVKTIARQVIDRLSQPYQIAHHTLYVGASVGSAYAPRDGKTVEELMRNSDLALYRAKDEGGGNHRQYEPTLHAVAEERRQLEFALRRALEREELTLNFQPVVDAGDESLVSFESLVRWNSVDHGFISPGKFIPLAEDTRLIVPIGEWVMEQSCREAMNWPDHVKVNVNVSAEQLVEPNFPATVVRALSNSGLPPHRLEVEVTESIFLRDANVARSALEQIMALGCGVALDDFGTGYSSLGYLRKLHFSTIKVDRSFVLGASEGHAESLAIIRAVVAMADSLEMTTTAEGVETEEQAAMIRNLGCTKIQGFHFGRPMPASEVAGLFGTMRGSDRAIA